MKGSSTSPGSSASSWSISPTVSSRRAESAGNRTSARGLLLAVALGGVSAAFASGTAAAGEEGARPGPGADLFALRPVRLSLVEMFGAGQPVPIGDSYTTEGYFVPPIRLDWIFGAIVPFEGSGMAFGAATSAEDFEPGGMFGVRGQFLLAPNVYFGAEFDFAVHGVDPGPVFFEGDMGRAYFMFPLTYEVPLGSEAYGAYLNLSVAPGVQIAFPGVDDDIRRSQAFLGRFIDEEDYAAFTLRAAAALHVPVAPWTSFLLEVSYDWAYGSAEVIVRNSIGQVLERRADEIDMSSLNVFAGFSFAF